MKHRPGVAGVHFLQPSTRVVASRGASRRHPRVICSLARGPHLQLLALSSATLTAYGERWGWDVVLSSENLAPDRPPSWSKVRLMQDLIRRYETVFWIDADALIVDLGRDVISELDGDFDVYLAHHVQAEPAGAVVPNFGVVILRQSEYTSGMLDRLWSSTEFIDHNWWENAALMPILGYSPDPPWPHLGDTADSPHFGPLGLAWNSVPRACEDPHPAIRHHARADDRSFETRLAGMTADLQAVVASAAWAAAARSRRRLV